MTDWKNQLNPFETASLQLLLCVGMCVWAVCLCIRFSPKCWIIKCMHLIDYCPKMAICLYLLEILFQGFSSLNLFKGANYSAFDIIDFGNIRCIYL